MKKYMLPFVFIGGWCMPGFAHWYYGRRHKALALFAIIIVCLVLGLVLSDFRALRYADNPFYYLGQFGCGLALLLNVFRTPGIPLGLIRLPYFEIGLLYTCVGALINLLTLLNLYSQLNVSAKAESGVPHDSAEARPPLDPAACEANKEQQ